MTGHTEVYRPSAKVADPAVGLAAGPAGVGVRPYGGAAASIPAVDNALKRLFGGLLSMLLA